MVSNINSDILREYAAKYGCCYDCLCDVVYSNNYALFSTIVSIALKCPKVGECIQHHPEMKEIWAVSPNLGAERVNK